jgi:protocatechuate 3,4-dioxygenase, alpha subunit
VTQPLDNLQETPSQTGGPYVHIGCIPTFAGLKDVYPEDLGKSPVHSDAKGQRITITGTIHDGTGWALRDAMFESWQADAAGKYPGMEGADPGVTGFCRFAADGESGEFNLRTIKPGAVGDQSPHIALWIVARGINTGLQTRIYFDDEDNSADPLLNAIEQTPRISTLLAKKTGEGAYRFDIRLQGEGETVFLDM